MARHRKITSTPKARPLRAVVYVDESGHAHPNFSEVNAVAGVAIPADTFDTAALTGFVGDVFERRYGDRSRRSQKLRVSTLNDDELRRLSTLFRTRVWYLTYSSLEPHKPSDNATWDECWQGMSNAVQAAKRHVRKTNDLSHLDRLLEAVEEMRIKHPLWSWLIFRVVNDTAKLFRSSGRLPNVEVVIDEHGGHSPPQREYLRFLTRFCFATQFHEHYANRLSAVLGIVDDGQFRCRTSSDGIDDGILIADLIANGCRRLHRGQDRDGRIQRFFDQCSVHWQPKIEVP